MKSLRQIIERVRVHRDQAWALATLVETRGSTYRKAGARMLVDQTGGYIGVLSGGCLEEEIARRAVEVIEEAPPALVEFDTRRLYGCNGLVRILVERHLLHTGSARARELLDDWDNAVKSFVKVMPKDYKRALLQARERAAAKAVAAE